MAQRTRLILIDDIDGREIATGGQTVVFAYQGIEYAIDLNDKNAEKLERTLAPWVAAARRTGGRAAGRPSKTGERVTTAGNKPADNNTIREWARNNGYQVSNRGRVSREVREAYAAS